MYVVNAIINHPVVPVFIPLLLLAFIQAAVGEVVTVTMMKMNL
jgi:hypothetical protein